MIKKIIALVCILCLLFVISGCGEKIGSDEEAAAEMSNVTEEIAGITGDLQEINQGLGSSST